MKIKCPKCATTAPNISKNGYFFRSSDSKKIQRYRCRLCKKEFSRATFSDCYLQKKRRLNFLIAKDLCSSTSMRRIALNYRISRTTVKRKLEFLSTQAKLKQRKWLKDREVKSNEIYFDDLESFESTKYKPLTVSVAVEGKSRKILGFRVSPIGAKGLLSNMAKKKYGVRRNISYKARKDLFTELKSELDENTTFKTDMHKDYPRLIREFFPKAQHKVYKSVRGSLTAQGELKRTGFDPLFCINHVFAMLRDNIKRLSRKTWCNTKKMKYLEHHLNVYVHFHNTVLT